MEIRVIASSSSEDEIINVIKQIMEKLKVEVYDLIELKEYWKITNTYECYIKSYKEQLIKENIMLNIFSTYFIELRSVEVNNLVEFYACKHIEDSVESGVVGLLQIWVNKNMLDFIPKKNYFLY